MSGNTGKKFGAFKIIAIVVAILVVGLVALPFFIDVNQFRPELESKLAAALGRSVKAGNLSLSLFSGAVGVDDIVISDDPEFSSSPFLKAKSFKVGVELKPLIFSREIRITEIVLENPSINLIRSEAGRWNFSNLGGPSDNGKKKETEKEPDSLSAKDIAIKQIRIEGGNITIAQGVKGRKPSTYSNVNITATDLSFASAFPFTLSATLPGGGSLSLKGKAGPISKVDLITTPFTADLSVKRFGLVDSGFVAPGTGLDGVIDFDGALTSDGRQVESKGTAQADRFQLIKGGSPASQTVSLGYAVNYDLVRENGVLDNAKLTYGKAVANLNGNFRRQRDAFDIKMRLNGRDMPVEDMKSLLPAFGVLLPKGASLEGGMLNADVTAEGLVDSLGITGSADITKTRLVGFDLAGKMAVLAKLAGLKPDPETEIETLASRVYMTPAGIRINNLQLVVPAIGELTGDGAISPDQALDFRMRALLTPSGGLGLGLTQLMRGSGGKLTIPFFIRGTASDPKFVPDLKNAVGGMLGSRFSGQADEEGETPDAGKAIGNAIKGLLGN
jgi:AsmA protein